MVGGNVIWFMFYRKKLGYFLKKLKQNSHITKQFHSLTSTPKTQIINLKKTKYKKYIPMSITVLCAIVRIWK